MFESLGVIIFKTTKSGYHNGTHGTQKCTYAKHMKLSRLERGHFEFSVIMQQDVSVDQHQYYEKVRLLEFFSKVFDLRTIFSAPNDIFANLTVLNITL